MFEHKVILIITLLSVIAFGVSSSARERSKTQGRQVQNFFPQQESSNPNFQSSPSDVYYLDSNNQLQDPKPKQQFVPNSKFSPNLQADLYNQQFGVQQQQQQQQEQQQLYQQQQQQQIQQQQQQLQQQQHKQQQLAQYQNQYSQQGFNQYINNPSKPFYPTPDGNDISYGEYSQQQYSPQSQHYVENNNIIYTDPTQYQSQSPDSYGQGFSQVVSGSYLVGERPQPPVVLPQHRPPYSLQSSSPQSQYGGSGGGSRPTYQSQQNYHLRPPPNGYGSVNEGGLMQSISNFFTNIGQSASEIFASRPPVSQYQPPPSVGAVISNRPLNSYNQQVGLQNQQQFGGPANQQFGGPASQSFGGSNPNPINQFSKAIEEITRNDDYQCIPKVICQMVGSQRRQPSILNSPIFTAIISAVPSTSAGLVYGRAALLGLIGGGDDNCHTSYPRCPRNEDDLLYYLNNHRGGFFRFFNGGAAFGDEATYQQQQQQQQQQNQYQQNQNQYQQNQYQTAASQQLYQQSQSGSHRPGFNQPSDDSSLQSNLASLQNIADAINNSGGINLSNLGSNANLFNGLAGLLNGGGGGGSGGNAGAGGGGGFDLSTLGNLANLFGGEAQAIKPSKAPPNDQGQSLTELVGNLLTGFVGQRFSSGQRKIKKRSIDINYDDAENSKDSNAFDSYPEKPAKKLSSFKLKLAASRTKFKFPDEFDELNVETDDNDGIEGRILNKKPAIYADNNQPDHKFVFNSQRYSKNVHSTNQIAGPTPNPSYTNNEQSALHFGNVGNNNDEFRIASNRRPQFDQFTSNLEQTLNFNRQQSTKIPMKFESFVAAQSPSKMIFPDRTGTGNLRFDHDEFNGQNQNNNNNNYNRYAKILNYGNRRPQNGNLNPVLFDQNDRYSSTVQQDYRPYFSSSSSSNANKYQSQNQPVYNNRFPSLSSSSHRDDSSSQNIYVTNGEGKIVYYINAQGKKVYV